MIPLILLLLQLQLVATTTIYCNEFSQTGTCSVQLCEGDSVVFSGCANGGTCTGDTMFSLTDSNGDVIATGDDECGSASCSQVSYTSSTSCSNFTLNQMCYNGGTCGGITTAAIEQSVSVPTAFPSAVPTFDPTAVPSAVPTPYPTAIPSAVPTFAPTTLNDHYFDFVDLGPIGSVIISTYPNSQCAGEPTKKQFWNTGVCFTHDYISSDAVVFANGFFVSLHFDDTLCDLDHISWVRFSHNSSEISEGNCADMKMLAFTQDTIDTVDKAEERFGPGYFSSYHHFDGSSTAVHCLDNYNDAMMDGTWIKDNTCVSNGNGEWHIYSNEGWGAIEKVYVDSVCSIQQSTEYIYQDNYCGRHETWGVIVNVAFAPDLIVHSFTNSEVNQHNEDANIEHHCFAFNNETGEAEYVRGTYGKRGFFEGRLESMGNNGTMALVSFYEVGFNGEKTRLVPNTGSATIYYDNHFNFVGGTMWGSGNSDIGSFSDWGITERCHDCFHLSADRVQFARLNCLWDPATETIGADVPQVLNGIILERPNSVNTFATIGIGSYDTRGQMVGGYEFTYSPEELAMLNCSLRNNVEIGTYGTAMVSARTSSSRVIASVWHAESGPFQRRMGSALYAISAYFDPEHQLKLVQRGFYCNTIYEQGRSGEVHLVQCSPELYESTEVSNKRARRLMRGYKLKAARGNTVFDYLKVFYEGVVEGETWSFF